MRVKVFGVTVYEKVDNAPAPPAVLEPKEKINTSTPAPKPTAWGAGGGMAGRNSRVIWRYFDGEKSPGGVGPIKRYTVDYEALRMRSWQLLLESEIVQIGISRWLTWAVGKDGLKLHCEPMKDMLAAKGITIDSQAFSKQVESFWKLYAGSTMCSYSNMVNFQQLIWEAEKNALLGGDCLWIVNITDGVPKVELKDGAHVRTPIFSKGVNPLYMTNPDNGNRIRHGIEIDEKGEHVAFYVNKGSNLNNSIIDYLQYERVPAKDAYGNIRAFMYYGIRYRLDDIRGIPLISVCMETTKQLEMYKEATVQGAVERAKVAYTIEHELGAVGINPLDSNLARGLGNPFDNDVIPKDINGQAIADTFAATTGRQAINLPVGAKANNLGSGQEVHFGEFYETNLAIVFAALDIPMEVALMKFGSNYSASRAAIKDWEHTLEVRRQSRIQKPYQSIFELFFLCQILKFEIQAPGYLEAFRNKNRWVMLAYTCTRWEGDRVPNIDEFKEVKATRELLGDGSKHLPIISMEEAMERHSGGEFRNTTAQYADELAYGEDVGIEKVEEKGMTIEGFDNPEDNKKIKK